MLHEQNFAEYFLATLPARQCIGQACRNGVISPLIRALTQDSKSVVNATIYTGDSRSTYIQSNLSYPGALGLGGARKTEICPYLRIQYKCIGYNRPHPVYCPQFLQDQDKIERISCPVEGGARIIGVRIREV